jgi:hypothetical protein
VLARSLASILCVIAASGAIAAAGAIAASGAGAATASAAAWPVDPTANIPSGGLPAACYYRPVSAACEVPFVAYLDAARQALGFGAYELPDDFVTLAPERQLLILVNLDRRSYSLPLVSGLSPELDAAAAGGAAVKQDPVAPSSYRALWASMWAEGLVNALDAYYQWMYLDGFPSLNIDCGDPAAVGCWVHRHGILFEFQPAVRLTMGVAALTGQGGSPVVGLIIAATRRGTGPSENYTWADAQADGAGRSGSAARHIVAPSHPSITSTAVDPRSRTATVHFTTGVIFGHAQCSLIGAPNVGRAPRRYSACASPARYAGLRRGVYDFSVRTVSPAGFHSAAVGRRLAIA